MYYIYQGIIDNFNFTLTKEEVLKSYICEGVFGGINNINNIINFKERLDKLEEDIKKAIYDEEKEHPMKIRYFGLPEYGSCDIALCVVAKVANNGSTYVFSENKDFLEAYNDGNRKIKKIK